MFKANQNPCVWCLLVSGTVVWDANTNRMTSASKVPKTEAFVSRAKIGVWQDWGSVDRCVEESVGTESEALRGPGGCPLKLWVVQSFSQHDGFLGSRVYLGIVRTRFCNGPSLLFPPLNPMAQNHAMHDIDYLSPDLHSALLCIEVLSDTSLTISVGPLCPSLAPSLSSTGRPGYLLLHCHLI